jgi:hypothetical protein
MYDYATEKPKIFTEDGQVMFLKIRDQVHEKLKIAGAIQMQHTSEGCTGNTWTMMACVDRLVELGEIAEVKMPGYTAGQHRIFVKIPLQ